MRLDPEDGPERGASIDATLLATTLTRVAGIGAHLGSQAQQHPSQGREQRRFEPEPGGRRADGIAVLGSTDATGTGGVDLEQPDDGGFGWDVDLWDEWLVVGAKSADGAASMDGVVHTYRRDAGGDTDGIDGGGNHSLQHLSPRTQVVVGHPASQAEKL